MVADYNIKKGSTLHLVESLSNKVGPWVDPSIFPVAMQRFLLEGGKKWLVITKQLLRKDEQAKEEEDQQEEGLLLTHAFSFPKSLIAGT